jgi:hypothetical protein
MWGCWWWSGRDAKSEHVTSLPVRVSLPTAFLVRMRASGASNERGIALREQG